MQLCQLRNKVNHSSSSACLLLRELVQVTVSNRFPVFPFSEGAAKLLVLCISFPLDLERIMLSYPGTINEITYHHQKKRKKGRNKGYRKPYTRLAFPGHWESTVLCSLPTARRAEASFFSAHSSQLWHLPWNSVSNEPLMEPEMLSYCDVQYKRWKCPHPC